MSPTQSNDVVLEPSVDPMLEISDFLRTHMAIHELDKIPTDERSRELYDQMIGVLIATAEDMLEKLLIITNEDPDAASKRDMAFATLNALWLAMIFGTVTLPAGFAVLGTGIGGIVGAGVGGTVTVGTAAVPAFIIGAVLGNQIGLGTGMVVSSGVFMAGMLATIPLMLYLNEKYPPPDDMVNAGINESLFVHLVQIHAPNRIEDLAKNWTGMRRLDEGQRFFLKSVDFLKKTVEQLAQVKNDGRVAANAPPARDLSDVFDLIEKVLSAENETIRDIWVAAFDLTSVRIKVADGRLALTVPDLLRSVGAPESVEIAIADPPDVKVGGRGDILDPYIRGKISFGPMRLHLGRPKLIESGSDRDRIRVEYSINRGFSPCTIILKYKHVGREEYLARIKPTLRSTLKAHLYFRVQGYGLVFDRIEIPRFSLSLPGLPDLQNLPFLLDLRPGLSDNIYKAVRNIFNHFNWAELMEPFKRYPASHLRNIINLEPQKYHVIGVETVKKLSITQGVFHAKTKAYIPSNLLSGMRKDIITDAFNSVRPIRKTTLTESSAVGPAATVFNHKLILFWIGLDRRINLANSANGTEFNNKKILSDTSSNAPSAVVWNNRMIVAWTGLGNTYLNIIQSTDGRAFIDKVTMSEKSPSAPSLAVFNDHLYIAWRGSRDNRINLMRSSNGEDWEDKITLQDTTTSGPAILSLGPQLMVAWRGVGNNQINTIITDNGRDFRNKVTLRETTTEKPSVAYSNRIVYLTWRGSGNALLNMVQSSDGVNWYRKFTSKERCLGGPILSEIKGEIIWLWTGSDRRLNTWFPLGW